MAEVRQRYAGGLAGKTLAARPRCVGDGSQVEQNRHIVHAMGKGDPHLDGLGDALDRAACTTGVPAFQERRDEEDTLAATVYPDLPHPESQLVALAHSL